MTQSNNTYTKDVLRTFYVPRTRVTVDTGTESMTKQSHKAECDINTILKQYQKTGIITHINNQQPLYTDLPSDIDFQQSLEILNRAEDAFASLPSKVRDHFNNSPQEFLEAFKDPRQRDYLTEMGLINRPPPQVTAVPLPEKKSVPDG